MPKLIPTFKNQAWLFEIIGYKPHEGQKTFHKNKARFKTLRCGRRFGKTTCGSLDKIHLICTPGSRGWIVAPNYMLGEKEFRVVWDAIFKGQLFPHSKLKEFVHSIPKKTNNPTQGQMHLSVIWKWDNAILFPNLNITPSPSEIIVKSADNPSGLLGDELDWILMAEVGELENSLEIWNRYLRMTLSSRGGEAVFPSTSYGGSNDLLDNMFDLGQNKKENDYASWTFPSFINPYWSADPEKEMQDIKKLPREAYEEQFLGKKVHYTGRYYKEFDHDVHVGKVMIDLFRPVFRSWDFGYRHPCIGFFQINKKDQIVWTHTYLGTDMDDLDLALIGKYLSGQLSSVQLPPSAKEIVNKEGLIPIIPPGEAMEFYDFCDAYGGVQEKSSRGSSIQILNNQMIYPRYTFERVKKDEDEPESIQIVRATLKVRDNGGPNLIIDDNNSLAIGMFQNMAYEESTSGIKSYKYKKEGYYEHPHDVYRYFALHTQKHLLYLGRKTMARDVAI